MTMTIFSKRRNQGKRSRQSGLATTEFALLMAFFLMPLLWGLLEASEAMTVNRRVTAAVNGLADLTAQSEALSEADLDALIDNMSTIVNPDAGAHPLSINVISVVPDGGGNPIVGWSRNDAQAEPYTAGSNYANLSEQTLLVPGASLVVVEMRYEYELSFFSNFFSDPVVFQRQAIRYPRLTNQVTLCVGPCPS